MSIIIKQVTTDTLPSYSKIPASLLVESAYRTRTKDGFKGIELYEEKVSHPYIKDYDAARGEGPTRWLKRFDMSNWGIFMAMDGDRPVGGTIVAPGAYVGDIDKTFAQLFDIRVYHDLRRLGTGTKLLQQAATFARQLNCKFLKIETQNTNIPACKFYARQGCKLGNIDLFAYKSDPAYEHEFRIVWYLEL